MKTSALRAVKVSDGPVCIMHHPGLGILASGLKVSISLGAGMPEG